MAADGTHLDGELGGFATAYRRLSQRIRAMLELEEEAMSDAQWRNALIGIGKALEGAT